MNQLLRRRRLFRSLNASGERRSRKSPSWTNAFLEPRVMLAGDVGTAIAQAPAATGDVVTQTHLAEQTNTRTLVVVDHRVADISALQAGASDGAELIIVTENQDALELIHSLIDSRQAQVESLHIVCHGSDGGLILGDRVIDQTQLQSHSEQLKSWSDRLTDSADILLYGCNVTASQQGIQFVNLLADLTGADVAASSDLTGNDDADPTQSKADWILETTTGHIDAALVFDATTRRSYQHTLDIVINAWGQTGNEQFDLQIDGQTVQSFEADTTWTPFVYETSESISADRVRIQFTNDAFDPQTGYDRNLFVNNIQIDGRNFETDSPDTFSTGSYLPEDGVQPGFERGIVLHANGYFQYSEPETGTTGTEVVISASGQTGEEILQLIGSDSSVIGEAQVSTRTQDFVFTVSNELDLTNLQVSFVNDLFDPASDIDRNLIVSSVTVTDLATYESESVTLEAGNESVFSTGTYLPSDGIVPGFGRGDTLHANGFFEFGSDAVGANSLQLDTSFGGDGQVAISTSAVIATNDLGRVATAGADTIEVRDASGNLDTQFAGDGSIALSELIGDNLTVLDLEYTSRGLLVGGTVQPIFGFGEPESPFVALLNPDGSFVDDFTSGVVESPNLQLGAFNDAVQVALDSYGGILIASETVVQTGPGFDDDTTADFALTRLDASGSLDSAFGDGGTLLIDRPFDDTLSLGAVFGLEQTSDGASVLGVSTFAETALFRVSPDGSLDTSFGDSGVARVADISSEELVIDSQGRIVGGGNRLVSFDNSYGAFRLLPNGDFDSSFGDNGIAVATLDPPITLLSSAESFFPVEDVVVQDDGGVLFVSSANRIVPGRSGFPSSIENAGTVVLRIDGDGILDSEFGSPLTNGYVLPGVGQGGQLTSTATLDSLGNLLLAGLTFDTVDTLATTSNIARFEFV